MKDKYKNIIIVVLASVLILAGAVIIYLINDRTNVQKELQGTVIVVDSEYILLETNEEDYIIKNITGNYEIGDKIKVTYQEKNAKESDVPTSIKADKDELIEKAPLKEQQDNKTENKENDTQPSKSVADEPIKEESKSKTVDEEVLTYIENIEKDFKSGSIKESLKSGFITVVDFLFYDGKIKGHTFKDLSDSAKLKVLNSALYFDGKIDEYFPGYKESISSTTGKIYTKAKEEIVESYLNVTTLICKNDKELCTTAKNGFSKIKETAGLTWSLIKDIAGDGLANLKNWYEIWSGK